MSENNCNSKNPLVRDGTSQAARFLAALDPDFVQVDERSLIDQINLLREYAGLVQYHNDRNEADGDWQGFFDSGMAPLVALINKFALSTATEAFAQLKTEVIDAGSNSNKIRRLYKSIFDLLFSLMYTVEQWHIKSAEGTLLRRELRRHISSSLRSLFAESLAYYKEAKKTPRISATSYHDAGYTDFITKNTNQILQQDFDPLWNLSSSLSWKDSLDAIAPDPAIFSPFRADVPKAANQGLNRLERIFEKVLSVYRQLADQSEALLNDLLENFPGHRPHMTLMLAFFQLLDHAREEMNSLTARHLDFYYQEVLQLELKPAVPDTVHLILELAKHLEEGLVKEDTEVKAGKDASGVERIYETDSEIVVNKGQIAELRSIFISRNDGEKVFSATLSNSADGAGAEFEEENPKWKAFGRDQAGLAAEERTMADARVGFAIASYDLFLQEGNREIYMDITCKSGVSSNLRILLKKGLSCRITAEEDWYYLSPQYIEPDKEITKQTGSCVQIQNKVLRLKLRLTKDAPPIVAHDPGLHLGGYTEKLPVLEILAIDGVTGNSYELLNSLQPTSISLKTEVNDLKDVVLQNDSSLIDTAKPFAVFGAQPRKGSSLYLGSTEVMGKNLSRLSLFGTWLDLPDKFSVHYANYDETVDNSSFEVDVENLRNGEWSAGSLPAGLDLFAEEDSSPSEDFELRLIAKDDAVLENAALEEDVVQFTSDSERGFIRLKLSAPAMGFGHQKFPFVMQKKAIEIAATTTPDTSLLPRQPYTPTLTDFRLQYHSTGEADFTSSQQSDYKKNKLKFYHILPFGELEMHPYLGRKNFKLATDFSHKHEGKLMEHEGEFYFAVEKLVPPQNLSLLIQLAEGSEDPKLPTTPVHWFYLSDDEWVEFETYEILQDTTNGLLKSGILQLAVPREASLKHHILPSGWHWFKAAMSENTAAVADLIDIQTQAVAASFDDRSNDPEHLKTALPAGSATKLVKRLSSIKSISQPYASFGGRVKEEPNDFYRRVSERLRHKDRGVSIWDYERLVLEEFPELHKVKCINHSSYGYDSVLEKDFDSEFAPGYVTLVVVPDLNNKNAIDPYEPAVSKARLEEIKDYLSGIMPAWAVDKLKVLNPLYEQVKVEFEVEFHSGYDRGFYEKQLNTDIKKLLAPWAFQEAEDILFGGKIYRSGIINYIEERPYVDYLKEFKMHHYVDKQLYKSNVVETLPTTSRSIFVSISDKDPAKEHVIKEVSVKC